MTQVIITTRTAEEMRRILALVRESEVPFEAVAIKKKTAAIGKTDKLKDEDWALPGRPATSVERREHAERISKQRGGTSTENLLKEMEAW
ncbi:MAG: hypothetical protein NTU44_16210 [Bacteroidetes bacterium]|nr:hypothetical protein [Bacteroidota bacterium]